MVKLVGEVTQNLIKNFIIPEFPGDLRGHGTVDERVPDALIELIREVAQIPRRGAVRAQKQNIYVFDTMQSVFQQYLTLLFDTIWRGSKGGKGQLLSTSNRLATKIELPYVPAYLVRESLEALSAL